MPFPRASGILLHPTSFPSPFGIGDLGSEAYRFVDFLVDSGQQLWQVLPLGPTGDSHSPYASYSAMAGNPLLLSPEVMQNKGLLDSSNFRELPEFKSELVDFEQVIQTKIPMLRQACENFQTHATAAQKQEFEKFCQNQSSWLDDFALFMALKQIHGEASWNTWDVAIALRQAAAILQWQERLRTEIFYHKYLQFEFFCQWSELKRYANQRGIWIIGDIPIYVAYDSADVWANPENFCLDQQTMLPALFAGTPPDFFSTTGQLWGNPVYNWEQLQLSGFKWWVQRFESMLDYVDIIRIDHFRGFQAYWAVKQGEATAENGEWIQAPGKAFFEALKAALSVAPMAQPAPSSSDDTPVEAQEHKLKELGCLPILAEDLGEITPDVEALRDYFEFPGMRILQFAFGSGIQAEKRFLPFNYQSNCLVYTGTHDNDTTVGWFKQLSPEEQEQVKRYLGCTSSEGIHWDLIRLAHSSVANQAIIPLQDILGLDTSARMNFPGTATGNWRWRYKAEDLTQELCHRLRTMTETYDRTATSHKSQVKERK